MPQNYSEIFNYILTKLAPENWISILSSQIKDCAMFFLSPSNQLYWPCIVVFISMAAVAYWYYFRREKKFSLRSFFEFCFPKKIYTHKSALIDYQIYLINHIFFSVPTEVILFAYRIALILFINKSLVAISGQSGHFFEWGFTTSLTLLVIGRVLIGDFCHYLFHRFLHDSAVFWPLHRVHHSASVLTPITVLRKHPILELVGGVFTTTFWATFEGILFWVFVGPAGVTTVLGVNVLRVVFNFCGAALRHSHIWISYGPVLSHIFISPAQHQIHHSKDPQHYDKNFGEIFAIWDWMFGTLYIPRRKEELEFGLSGHESQIHNTLGAAYFEPIHTVAKNMITHSRNRWTLASSKRKQKIISHRSL